MKRAISTVIGSVGAITTISCLAGAVHAQQTDPFGAFGVSGGIMFIDESFASGIEVKPAARIHFTNRRSGRFGIDASVMGVFGTVLDADLALGGDLGANYLLGSGRFSFSLGPSALIPLGGGDSDFFPGFYAAINWVIVKGFFLDLRQHVYFKSGEVPRYPSIGIGWLFGVD